MKEFHFLSVLPDIYNMKMCRLFVIALLVSFFITACSTLPRETRSDPAVITDPAIIAEPELIVAHNENVVPEKNTGVAESPALEKVLSPIFIKGSSGIEEMHLASFLQRENPSVDPDKAQRMARYYIEEAKIEGIIPEIAFMQMCLETGFLKFGGLVSEDMNNFCGLGSIGAGQNGNSFADERTGVRAHVQHLKAYATADPLVGELVDPRYKYVNPKGKAPTIYGLAGTWASDPNYGQKLDGLLVRLYASL